jgi:hypothetical protein
MTNYSTSPNTVDRGESAAVSRYPLYVQPAAATVAEGRGPQVGRYRGAFKAQTQLGRQIVRNDRSQGLA